MRDTFVKTLIKEAKKNKDIELLTGDLGFGVLKPYWEELPDQFTNVGIAEQNMTTVAAGMALEGKIVFTYSIGNFPTLRCLEQIRNDCAYHHANVKIVCIGGGFVYGSLGMSHQATEDISVMRALPDVAVFCPGDLVEAEAVTKAMIAHQGTCYLRLGRGGEKQIHENISGFTIGKAITVTKPDRDADGGIAIFSTGAVLDQVCPAVEALQKKELVIEQYSFPTIKPIDKDLIKECAERCTHIFTIEEHSIIGGLGGAVAEILAESSGKAKLTRIGIPDSYCHKVGSQSYLREQYGLLKDKIYFTILDYVEQEKGVC